MSVDKASLYTWWGLIWATDLEGGLVPEILPLVNKLFSTTTNEVRSDGGCDEEISRTTLTSSDIMVILLENGN